VQLSRILVVDDHIALGQALVARLSAEPDVHRAHAVATARDALAAVGSERFDIALVDVDLGADDGLVLCARLHEREPELRLVMLSCATETATVMGALRAGAVGWVPKDMPMDQLLDAFRQVRAGAAWLPGWMLRGVLDEFFRDRSEQDRVQELLGRLSVREQEVLTELADGQDLPSIAERLFLSQNTVRTHVQNILAKLEVHSRLAAVALVRGHLGRSSRPEPAIGASE
jgi:DNA-binding NarL/FixJ family response regulator